MKPYAAEFIGTFWLVLGGCGSAVLAAAFPELGHRLARRLARLRPHRADHGLRDRPHLGLPPQSGGLDRPWRGGRFPAEQAAALHRRAGARRARRRRRSSTSSPAARPASSWPAASPRTATASTRRAATRCFAALVTEVVMTLMFLLIILGATDKRAPHGFAPIAIGLGADADPPDQHPGHQHLGQPGAQHRRRLLRRRLGARGSSGCSGSRRSSAPCSARSPTAPSRARTPERGRERPRPGRAALKTLACAAAAR